MTKNGNPQYNPLYKTQICYGYNKIGKQKCPNTKAECSFAHGKKDLKKKPIPEHIQKYRKTEICPLWANNKRCERDIAKCNYAHGEDDQRPCVYLVDGKCPYYRCKFKHPKPEKKKEDTSFKKDRGNDTRGSTKTSIVDPGKTYKEAASSASSRPSTSSSEYSQEKDLAKMTTAASESARDEDFCTAEATSSSSNVFYFGKRKTSDCTVQAGKAKYYIHKGMVAVHSSKFDKLFSGTPGKVDYDLKELDTEDPAETLNDIFQIIYDFTVVEQREIVHEWKTDQQCNSRLGPAYVTRATEVIQKADQLGFSPAVRRYYELRLHQWLCDPRCPRCTALQHLSDQTKNLCTKQHTEAKEFLTLSELLRNR